MKKTIYSLLAITALLFSSCESFTELEPKGKNLLTTTDQLEMLLNKEYEGCSSDMRQMAGDMIYAYSNVATARLPTQFSQRLMPHLVRKQTRNF